jgi:hypothetical protein
MADNGKCTPPADLFLQTHACKKFSAKVGVFGLPDRICD